MILAFLAEVITIVWVFPMLKAMGIIAGATKPVADAAPAEVTRRWVLVDKLRCVFLLVPSFVSFVWLSEARLALDWDVTT